MSTDLTGIESQLVAASDAAKLAAAHAAEWRDTKAIKAGSLLADTLDSHLTSILERLAAEKTAEADRIGKQLQRMRLEDEQRRLQQQIADNESKLRTLN